MAASGLNIGIRVVTRQLVTKTNQLKHFKQIKSKTQKEESENLHKIFLTTNWPAITLLFFSVLR